ncbi:hypothetical protein AUC43_12515 [Hymenobacter sedentarius]|uniref:General stress protein 17M-like domain-containing protein n=1 Tax=Hymenobacter sedentarius TaxID=1411621 RepID=A0A0U3SZ63_9BACT|nr:hypothetical protein [Hymenobacter sedentarius]ALW85843.1 hypothetical protein AUC43_12515 [Hymenobacter sedentarius]
MAGIVVGLFTSSIEAQAAVEQLLAAGFERSQLNLATRDTLRGQHLTTDAAAPTESVEDGVVRFFTDLFAGNENAEAQAHIAASGPDSAVLTVNTATDEQAQRAGGALNANGAVDVYRQAQSPGNAAASSAAEDDIVDLEGSLSRVRDDDELDANGVTTH